MAFIAWSTKRAKAPSSPYNLRSWLCTAPLYSGVRTDLIEYGLLENFRDLFLQDLRCKRLDNIVADTCLHRLDQVALLRLGRHHQNRCCSELFVRSDRTEHVDARHDRHVPVGHDEAIAIRLQLLQRFLSIFGFFYIRESQLLQDVLDDSSHRYHVIDHEDF